MLLFFLDQKLGNELAYAFQLPTSKLSALLVFAACVAIIFASHYLVSRAIFHWRQKHTVPGQLPPRYPALIPWVGNAFEILFSGQRILEDATKFEGQLTSCRLHVFGFDLCFIQDRHSVAALWKQRTFSTPKEAYVLVLRSLFGMKRRAIQVFERDDSGPLPAPHVQSKVEPRNRVIRIMHEQLVKGLTGADLEPMTDRATDLLQQQISDLSAGKNWVEYPDMLRFFENLVGSPIMRALVGPGLFRLSPSFTENLWKFDKSVPMFAKGIPSLFMPRAVAIRKRLLEDLKLFYKDARFQDDIHQQKDLSQSSGCWGSWLLRVKQQTLLSADGQDDDSLASTDLALIWGAVSNPVRSSMMALVHIFSDPALLNRLRASLNQGRTSEIEQPYHHSLVDNPLLMSIYCETLRLYVKTYVMASNQRSDALVGRWHVLRKCFTLVNSSVSHMDSEVWNTKDGMHPLHAFWADRFIIYPLDESSGPVRPELRSGTSICPGRFMARNVILLACALVVTNLDLEFSVDGDIKMNPDGFGLGTLRPMQAIPFKLRARQ
nr:cholesterol 7-alpha-monooxygenase [Quercus suber]